LLNVNPEYVKQSTLLLVLFQAKQGGNKSPKETKTLVNKKLKKSSDRQTSANFSELICVYDTHAFV
jgi:hypothetical protein